MRAATLTTVLVLAITTSPAFGRQAVFVPIGSLPGSTLIYAYDVDRSGTTVVGASGHANGLTAFRWTAALGMHALPPVAGVIPARAEGVSGSGSEVAAFGYDSTVDLRIVHWTVGQGTQDLGPGAAHGISSTGFHVVGGARNPLGLLEAFVWSQASGNTPLGTLPGDNWSNAWGVNASGLVVIGSSTTYTPPGNWGPAQAFRWTPGSGMVGLGFLPGGSWSHASDLSEDGSVVVGRSTNGAGQLEAFRWTTGAGMVGLGQLGGSFGTASGVSGDGSTIVGYASPATGAVRAIIWTPSLGMLDLRDHLISRGATGLTGWELQYAWAISDSGNAIVGSGSNQAGQAEAFIAYLDGPPANVVSFPVCTPGVANSTLFPGVMVATGSNVVADNDVTLEMRNIPIGAFGLFLNSMSLGAPVVPPASEGRLCLTGSIGRHIGPGQVMAAVQGSWPGAFGVISLQLDLTSMPTPVGPVSVLPGDTWYFQGWYRGTPNSILSTGVSVQFM